MGWVPFQLLYLGPFSNVRCTYINGEVPLNDKADVLKFEIGRQLVNCNARNEPTADLEYLYDTAEWLQSKILEE